MCVGRRGGEEEEAGKEGERQEQQALAGSAPSSPSSRAAVGGWQRHGVLTVCCVWQAEGKVQVGVGVNESPST